MTDKREPVVKPLHCGISVPDLEASIAWYVRMLGFTVVSNKYIAALKAKIAFLKLGDFSIELFETDHAAPLPPDRRIPNLDIKTHGIKHVAYRVEDLTALMTDLKEREVDVAMDVFPMEGDLVAFIRDNTGNLLELIEVGGSAK